MILKIDLYLQTCKYRSVKRSRIGYRCQHTVKGKHRSEMTKWFVLAWVNFLFQIGNETGYFPRQVPPPPTSWRSHHLFISECLKKIIRRKTLFCFLTHCFFEELILNLRDCSRLHLSVVCIVVVKQPRTFNSLWLIVLKIELEERKRSIILDNSWKDILWLRMAL